MLNYVNVHAESYSHTFYPGTGVSTYAVNPGIVDTDLKRHLMDSVYRRTMGKINSYFMKSPEAGCQTVLYCALSPDLADESGFMYRLVFLILLKGAFSCTV